MQEKQSQVHFPSRLITIEYNDIYNLSNDSTTYTIVEITPHQSDLKDNFPSPSTIKQIDPHNNEPHPIPKENIPSAKFVERRKIKNRYIKF